MKSQQSLKEYGRGIVGGLLFSLPIIYTMEVWWTGFIATTEKLFIFVLATYLLLLGYNQFAGMRKDHTFLEVAKDSVEEIGLAFVVTFLFLLLIARLDFKMSLYVIAGKTIVETMIVAIGISIGTSQLGENKTSNTGSDENPKNEDENTTPGYFQFITLSICGAVLISSAVAPTDEIVVIAVGSSNIHLICMVIVSIILTWITVFYSNFRGTVDTTTSIVKMISLITVGYFIALLVATGLLWFFGRFAGFGFHLIVAQIVVLAIPATLGASAGRLLLQSKND